MLAVESPTMKIDGMEGPGAAGCASCAAIIRALATVTRRATARPAPSLRKNLILLPILWLGVRIENLRNKHALSIGTLFQKKIKGHTSAAGQKAAPSPTRLAAMMMMTMPAQSR